MDLYKAKPRVTSFFKQLQEFCSHVECEVSNLKREFEKPPGVCPRNYYRGLKMLKSEIGDLKKLEEETKEKMCKVHQFGYFVHSVQELLKEQADDVKAMEVYLEKYGYQIPEESKFSNKYESSTEESGSEDKSYIKKEIPGTKLVSPELSEIGKEVVERKNLQSIKVVQTSFEPINMKEESSLVTPPQRKKKPAWYSTPIPNLSSMKRVERWVESVEAEASFAVTPFESNKQDSKRMRENNFRFCSPLMKGGGENLRLRMNPNTLEEESIPEEPVLSSLRELLLQEKYSSHSPEEPTLSEIGMSVVNRLNTDVERHTPEEPQLSSFGKKIVESKSAQQDGSVEERCTPEEPLLSYQTYRVRNAGVEIRPKHSSQQNLSLPQGYYQDLLPSPQLSDITQKILNMKSLRFSEFDPKDCYSSNTSKCSQSSIGASTKSVVMEPKSPLLSDVTLKILNKYK